jgi:hypothetical protein
MPSIGGDPILQRRAGAKGAAVKKPISWLSLKPKSEDARKIRNMSSVLNNKTFAGVFPSLAQH